MRNAFDNPLLLLVLLVIIVLVFGAKRLPDAARSLGRSMRIFKSEVSQMKDDDADRPAARNRPIEGRVVDDTAPRATDPSAPDRHPTDEPHRGS
jgi:sec-independent protein translocase protein TatA